MDLRQLVRLKRDGCSNRRAADFLHVSRNTVNEYVRIFDSHGLSYEELMCLSEKELYELFPCSSEIDSYRFQTLAGQFSRFEKELKKPGCTLRTLWNEYINAYPDGYMYSRFCHHLSQWRDRALGSAKLDHKYGEKVFIDFTGKKLSYVDRSSGQVVEVNVFVAVLPATGYTYVVATLTQSQEEVIEALGKCFHYLGGVPRVIVSDNLKAVVAKSHKYEPTINRTLNDFALHYGCVIDPARPYCPQDKAMVEGAVKIVYQRIFYPLGKHTFFTLESLNEAIGVLLETYNNYQMSRSNETRSQLFYSLEQNHLQPLPSEPYIIRNFKSLTVQKMGHIFLAEDKHYYSVPYRFIGRKVDVQYTISTVEIYFERERIALHKRTKIAGKYTTISNHLSSSHRVYSEWSLDFFCTRAEKIGRHTEQFIREMILSKEHPEVAYKQALGITLLPQKYPLERIENACLRALSLGRYGYHIIENILKNGMDQVQSENYMTPHIPPHANIRGGSNYY